MTESYDPNVCYLTFLEENYLFVLERSKGNCDASNSQRCAWDLQNDDKVARAIPSSFSGPQTYFCDGNYRPLAWANEHGDVGSSPPPNGTNAPASPPPGGGDSASTNGYKCVCGGPIDNFLTHGRTDRPWKGAFGKRCNVITDFSLTKGDFGSTFDASQGVCATMAGQSNNASLVVKGDFPYPDDALTAIDKYGIVYLCNDNPAGPNEMGKRLEQICSCDGPLPETAFGQQLKSEQRDRCGLESAKRRTGIIAGSVMGGVLAIGLVSALVAILYLHRRKRRKSRSFDPMQSEDDDRSMDSGVELMDKSSHRVYNSI